MDLCIYCDVGFGFRFSPPIWGVVDPRGGVAKWLAFPLDGNRLREIQKSVNIVSATFTNALNFSGFFILDRSLALRLNGPWAALGEDSSLFAIARAALTSLALFF